MEMNKKWLRRTNLFYSLIKFFWVCEYRYIERCGFPIYVSTRSNGLVCQPNNNDSHIHIKGVILNNSIAENMTLTYFTI